MIIKKQVVTGFCRGAKSYDQVADLQSKTAQSVIKLVRGGSVHRVLEMGCGTGILSQSVLALFPDAHFCLTDIAPDMLEQCRQKIPESKSVQYLCADGEYATWKAKFDLIVSNMVIHWFNQPMEGLRHLRDKLQQNGRLVFSILGAQSFHEWQSICAKFDVPVATPVFPSFHTLKQDLPDFTFHLDSIKMKYKNVNDFLTTLKRLGAATSRAHYVPMPIKTLRKILREYKQEIEITYEIIYGEYTQA